MVSLILRNFKVPWLIRLCLSHCLEAIWSIPHEFKSLYQPETFKCPWDHTKINVFKFNLVPATSNGMGQIMCDKKQLVAVYRKFPARLLTRWEMPKNLRYNFSYFFFI